MTNDLVKNGYDEIGERYANDRGHWPSNRYLGRFSRNLPRTAKILDLGCGTGVPIDRYLIGKGHEVVGLDISDRQLALARKNNPAAQYEAKDMQGLRDSEYSVDGLVYVRHLSHAPRNSSRAFPEITFVPAQRRSHPSIDGCVGVGREREGLLRHKDVLEPLRARKE